MRLLLDTHTLLWLVENDARLSDAAKAAVFSADYVAVSVASLWEIAIKQSIGKLDLDASVEEVANACTEQGVDVLRIAYQHLDAIKLLSEIHRDPFDRLLVATAQCEDMTIVTKDENIAKYDVQTVWQ